MKPRLTDYWDQRFSVIDTAASEIESLDAQQRAIALEDIARCVTRHVDVLHGHTLLKASMAVTDDLYKAAVAIDRWDEHLEAYLSASAGTLSGLLSQRGVAIQYLVDNTWHNMQRPVELFEAWYDACGFVYICPQVIALDLIDSDQQPPGVDRDALVPRYVEEARDVTDQLVDQCQADRRHFFQLDTDWNERSFTAAMRCQGEAGTLTVFRNEIAEPDTKVMAWYPRDGKEAI